MKKMYLSLAGILLLAGFSACTNNTDSTTTAVDSSSSTMKSGDTSTAGTSRMNADSSATTGGNMNSTSYSNAKLNKEDSTFVMKAAMGGMEEVQGGQAAQQNGQNDRVKNFGQMMVNDHGKANQELMSLASAKGITIPTTLPTDKQKMVDQMKGMQGASFDKHYMGMMVTDHKKDVAEFEKEAKSANDPDLKAWAAKTLPVLKTHLDSAQAINGSIK